ncbi:hypothetical protein M446_4568 [Methylobacterium sp. 4-46]|uniref:hypothetical protein n=1 Tax=unclassified Methylobacterium TaxID=2615210 RepID=UPI000165CE1C|nr:MULTISPECIES: hypothetical protein [Methylobacterium]ACA18909.1 hypothetical protein M446_4568 [Methylobacterium sp. 4-46]WFT78131.1 hypothetical protein QA634_22920 [Methylobacterium nodulans]
MVFLLAAAAVTFAVIILLLVLVAGDRRPPLRLPREHLLEERGDELYDALGPRPHGLVDRSDAEPEAPAGRLPGPAPRPAPHRSPPQVIDHDPDEHRHANGGDR